MLQVRGFSWNWRVGLGALLILFGATHSPARADLITGTDSTGQVVSIFVKFYVQPNGTPAPLILSNNGQTVNPLAAKTRTLPSPK